MNDPQRNNYFMPGSPQWLRCLADDLDLARAYARIDEPVKYLREVLLEVADVVEHEDRKAAEFSPLAMVLHGHPPIPIPPTVPERTAARFTGPTITPEEN